MKQFFLGITMLLSFEVIAQEQKDETLFKVEYELNGQGLESYAFAVNNCAQTTVYNAWHNWIVNKGGSTNLLKKYEASNVKFKNSDDIYKAILSFVEDTPTKFTVITTLTDQNGMSLNDSSPEFTEIYERLRDLSFQSRKACVRNDLRFANELLMKLSRQTVEVQTKKGAVLKNSLRDGNELLKLENKHQQLGEQLDLLENQLERASDDKMVDAVMKKKNKTESNFQSVDGKLSELTQKIEQAEVQDTILDKDLDRLTWQLQTQREIIRKLRSNYTTIVR